MSYYSQVLTKYNQDKLALWMKYGGLNYMTGTESGTLTGDASKQFGADMQVLDAQLEIDLEIALQKDAEIDAARQKAEREALLARQKLAEQQRAAAEAEEAAIKAAEDARIAAENLAAGKQILLTAYQQGIISSDLVQKAIDNGIIEKPEGFVNQPAIEIETTGVPIATPYSYPVPKSNSSLIFSLVLIGLGAYIIFKD